jgi:aryl-alcohol dehydrogenase-like predicted oxidoreductase
MLSKFAQSNGRSCSELALSWAMRRPEISMVLVGVRDGGQLRTCVNAGTWNLSPNQLSEIENIIAKSHFSDRVRKLPEYFFEQ